MSDWRDRARCRSEDPELFFPVLTIGPAARAQVAEAKTVCKPCPVRSECLDWALDTGQGAGIWGGKDEAEIRAIRRKRKTA